MKLEDTENKKLRNVNTIRTTTSQMNHIHDSDVELAEENHSNIKHLREKSKL